MITRSDLARVVLLELRDDTTQVGLSHALVAIRQDRETDQHVGMRKLGRATRHILADERYRHHEAAVWRARIDERHVGRAQDAVRDAVDLCEYVWQQRARPVGGEVEQLARLGKEAALDRLAQCLERRRAVGRQVAHERLVVDRHGTDKVAVQPQQRPLRQERLEVRVVEGLVQQHQVRVALQRMALVAALEHARQLGHHLVRGRQAGEAFRLGERRRVPALERLAHGAALQIEDRVQQVDRQLPPVAREIDRYLVADRKVELATQRMQQHVDLVHDQHARAPQVEDAHQRVGHVAARRHLVAHAHQLLVEPLRLARQQAIDVELLDRVRLLGELEHERLDGLGRRAHDAAVSPRAVELRVQPCHELGAVLVAALELERKHALDDDGREATAHHVARLLQQRRRHHLRHERLAVGEYQCQQRPDDRRLAGAHDHLLHARLAAPHIVHEPIHHLDLSPAQQQIKNVLKHQEARVVRQTSDVRRRVAHVVSLRHQQLSQRAHRMLESLAQRQQWRRGRDARTAARAIRERRRRRRRRRRQGCRGRGTRAQEPMELEELAQEALHVSRLRDGTVGMRHAAGAEQHGGRRGQELRHVGDERIDGRQVVRGTRRQQRRRHNVERHVRTLATRAEQLEAHAFGSGCRRRCRCSGTRRVVRSCENLCERRLERLIVGRLQAIERVHQVVECLDHLLDVGASVSDASGGGLVAACGGGGT